MSESGSFRHVDMRAFFDEHEGTHGDILGKFVSWALFTFASEQNANRIRTQIGETTVTIAKIESNKPNTIAARIELDLGGAAPPPPGAPEKEDPKRQGVA